MKIVNCSRHSSTRPEPRLVDGMEYVHSTATDIRSTWERHGFKPTTEAERAKRNAKHRVQA